MPAYHTSGFSVREPAWHGLSTVLADYPESADEARRAAGLLWEPKLIPVFERTLVPAGHSVPMTATVLDGEIDFEDGAERCVARTDCTLFVPVENYQGVARDDTGAILGVPTKAFQPVYNSEMFEICEALLAVPGANVKYETAGSVRGGKTVYVLVYLDEPWSVRGDESATLPFFAITNHHDGSGAAKGIMTDVRIVCWNTVQMAEAQGNRSGQAFSIRHTGDTAERIEAAKEAIAELRETTKRWHLRAEHLAGLNVSDALVRTFFEEWIPTPEHATDRLVADRAERREQMFRLYSEAATLDGIRGTAYGLFQACTEYLDHLRPFRSRDTYLGRTMLAGGDSGRVKADTLRLIEQMAAVGA